MPGLNDEEIVLIAEKAEKLGAKQMDILPFLLGSEPGQGHPSHVKGLSAIREACTPYFPKFAPLRRVQK
jgi:hypothetical protein